MAAVMTCLVSLLLLISLVGQAHSGHFAYTSSDQSYPCIMMDATFSIHINAVRYKRIIAEDIIGSEDQIIDVTGSCSKTTAIMNLAFAGRVTWSFIFRTDGNVVTLDRLVQFIPKNIFASYITNISDPLTFDYPNTIDLSYRNESYVCKSKKKSQYFPIKAIKGDTTFTILTVVKNVRAQAFGLKNGRYSSKAVCYDDVANVTTRRPTTSTTLPTTSTTGIVPNDAPKNSYYVTDKENTTLCIEMTGRIVVDIRYEYNASWGGVSTRHVSFPIPSNATWYGNCKLLSGRQNIVIEFFKPSWSLEFIFKEKHSSNLTSFEYLKAKTQNKLDYTIESINLIYINDHEKFPGSILPEGKVVRESSEKEEKKYPRKSLGKGYFSCSSDVTLKIDKNAAINTEEFEFKAFNDGEDYKFEGTPSKCTADHNDTLRPVIIVCSVFGGLLLIIIIIVIISIVMRRKRRQQYKPIRGKAKKYNFVYR